MYKVQIKAWNMTVHARSLKYAVIERGEFLTSLYRFLPSPPLAAFIEAFWLSDGPVSLPTRERCLPDGSMAVIINLGHDLLRASHQARAGIFQSFHGGVFSGASSHSSIIDMSTMGTTVSIQFKPGGARPFLPLPALEAANQTIELSTLWGAEAADLREQLQAVITPERRVRILERFLLAHVNWERMPHLSVAFALAQFQPGYRRRAVSDVTEQIGMSPKRFIHLFREAVGLTPKVYCRVLRFQEVLRLLEEERPISWADLALDCGYFDQAHFIHDFQNFSGLTPSAYLENRRTYRNHIPLPD
ncbi:helix-turn-helix domain-containing protein [Ktedonospora formicarum]|uniref:HTH araC/xylS-type domain-containing protein n=1 Tax=Ktedonospora formicarum TaxID=2778364 RepID=A0A8J3I476_9CHLR|nr:helix-turn-helix domain-containing protein [Ktedonospora formicarum]GHO45648.1 hypothetical protein KSX_38110 [Ktedonospora formicarum]